MAVVLVVLLILGGTGLVIYAVFRAAYPSSSTEGPGADTVHQPVTINTDDGDLVVTVLGASAQPGGAWHLDNFDPAANLVVELSLELINAKSESVITPMVWWQFVPTGGSEPLGSSDDGGYQPSLSYPRLAPNVTSTGYLAFPTTATGGKLSVAGKSGLLADWELTAMIPEVVTGSIGEPVRGKVGLPAFTVTLDSIVTTDSNPDLLSIVAQPGANYLVADLTVTALDQPFVDLITHDEFIFIGADGELVESSFGAVQDDSLFVNIGNGETRPIRVAFATPAGSGSLELRDRAGRTVLSWPVS
ncbi:MAG: hypothetical protein ABWZ02_12660 [Nakamurella sp.]